ncbi:MAG: hypothetical protein LBT52_04060 [Clostridiales Family XIII bacterium]|jgi:lipoate-protein ligase A|nr:hypothetical protein [Clostridiales Family XIII bacterium]
MIYIEPKSMDCAFHFAAEEYVMRNLRPSEPTLMLWRTGKTAMIGANQIAEIEADLPYARGHDIAVVRRSSGGGTIYTDPGTLLYTIILPYASPVTPAPEAGSTASAPKADAESAFRPIAAASQAVGRSAARPASDTKSVIKDYLAGPVINTLKGMGIPASLEGRNDILVDGRKISGIAQYIKYGYLCSHGSLLFDADITELVRVLTVDDEKIRSKALRSIRSRVTNIAEHLPKNQPQDTAEHLPENRTQDTAGHLPENRTQRSASHPDELEKEYNEANAGQIRRARPGEPQTDHPVASIRGFMSNLRDSWDKEFGLTEYFFSDDDLAGLEKIRAEKYGSEAWTFGHTPRYSFRNAKRFPGGGVEVFAEVKHGAIHSIKITGDFLALRPTTDIEKKLSGLPFRRDALANILTESEVTDTLGSVTKDELLSVFG